MTDEQFITISYFMFLITLGPFFIMLKIVSQC